MYKDNWNHKIFNDDTIKRFIGYIETVNENVELSSEELETNQLFIESLVRLASLMDALKKVRGKNEIHVDKMSEFVRTFSGAIDKLYSSFEHGYIFPIWKR